MSSRLSRSHFQSDQLVVSSLPGYLTTFPLPPRSSPGVSHSCRRKQPAMGAHFSPTLPLGTSCWEPGVARQEVFAPWKLASSPNQASLRGGVGVIY